MYRRKKFSIKIVNNLIYLNKIDLTKCGYFYYNIKNWVRQTYEKIHAPGEREADNYMNQVFKNCRLRRAEGLIKEGPNWEKLAKFRDDGTLDRRVPPFRTERDYFHPAALQKGLYLRQKKILI